MISQIAKAMSSGFTADQILDFILKKFPKHAGKISTALSHGFSADQILRQLSGGKKSVVEGETHGMTDFEKTRNRDREKQQSINKGAASLAGTAAGTAALGFAAPLAMNAFTSAAPAAAKVLQRAAPQIFGPGSIPTQAENLGATDIQGQPPQTQIQSTLLEPTQSSASDQLNHLASQPPVNVSPNITQPTEMQQPKTNTIDASKVLDDMKITNKVDELIKSGNDPESVSAYFKKFYPAQVKEVEKKAEQDFENVINSHIQNKGKPKDVANPNKGSLVAYSQGVGKVKEIRNGQALIDVDGKLHKVKEEELIQSPIPEKELADLYDDLISGIEKKSGQQVSRNVDWAGYDPNSNELAYKPHGSEKLYVYDDISPEDIDMLTNLMTQRKSTGQNYVGAWEKGSTSPIGTGMYQLIQKLQKERGGKGNEYRSRYDTIYDAIELAKKASKERHAKRKKEAKKPRLD